MKLGPIRKKTPLVTAISSMTLYYLALPPLNLSSLAFLPPIFWLFLIVMEKPDSTRSPKNPPSKNPSSQTPSPKRGETAVENSAKTDVPPKRGFIVRIGCRLGRFFRSFYGQLYAASLLFWGVSLLWLPLPHPAIWFGWGTLAAFMAIYFPLFVWGSRTLVHRFHFPLFLAPAAAWVGAEWFRKHLLGGFSFCSLEHAFYQQPTMIQTAEIMGEYGVGALIVLIGTPFGIAAHQILFRRREKKSRLIVISSLCWGMILLGIMIGYGRSSINRIERACAAASEGPDARPLRIALLQDGTYYQFPVEAELNRLIHQRYLSLSRKASQNGPLDLLVWPEGTFAYPFFEFSPNAPFPTPDGIRFSPEREREEIEKIRTDQEKRIGGWVKSLGCPVLFGVGTTLFDQNETRCYNSAVYWGEEGDHRRYDKRARVMFGEYIPFLEDLPEGFPLKTLCEPIAAGRRLGEIPVGENRRALVSICFESSIPRFVRSQIDQARRKGTTVNLLINISNDAWFFGGVENELHAATYPFRAVETRKFYLAAAHGGVSCALDPAGRVMAAGKKGDSAVVTAEFVPVELTPVWNGRGLYIGTFCALLLFLTLFYDAIRPLGPDSPPPVRVKQSAK